MQLALVCDYRLASEDARLGLPAVKECLIPSMSLRRRMQEEFKVCLDSDEHRRAMEAIRSRRRG